MPNYRDTISGTVYLLRDHQILIDILSPELRPLADAQVVLGEAEGTPGRYAAKLFIRPHYQLEGLTISNRLIGQLEHTA